MAAAASDPQVLEGPAVDEPQVPLTGPKEQSFATEKQDLDPQQQQQQQLLLLHPTSHNGGSTGSDPFCSSALAAETSAASTAASSTLAAAESAPATTAESAEATADSAAVDHEGPLLQWFPGFDLPIGLKGRATLRRILNQRRSLDAARCKQILSEHGIVLGRGVPGHTTNWGGLTVKELLHAAHLLGCWREVEELCLSFCCSNGLKIEWVRQLRARGPQHVTLANLLAIKRSVAAEARRKRQQQALNSPAAAASKGRCAAGTSGPAASAAEVAAAATPEEPTECKQEALGRRGGSKQGGASLKGRRSIQRPRRARVDHQQEQQQLQQQVLGDNSGLSASAPPTHAAAGDTVSVSSLCLPSALPLPSAPQSEAAGLGPPPMTEPLQQLGPYQAGGAPAETVVFECCSFSADPSTVPPEEPFGLPQGPQGPPPRAPRDCRPKTSGSKRRSRKQQQQQQQELLVVQSVAPGDLHSTDVGINAVGPRQAFSAENPLSQTTYSSPHPDLAEYKGAPDGLPQRVVCEAPPEVSMWHMQEQQPQQQQQHPNHQQQPEGLSTSFPEVQWLSGVYTTDYVKHQLIDGGSASARPKTTAEAAAAAAAQQLQLEDCCPGLPMSFECVGPPHDSSTSSVPAPVSAVKVTAAAAGQDDPLPSLTVTWDSPQTFFPPLFTRPPSPKLAAPQQCGSPCGAFSCGGPPFLPTRLEALPPSIEGPVRGPKLEVPEAGYQPLPCLQQQQLQYSVRHQHQQQQQSGALQDSSSDVSCSSWGLRGPGSSSSNTGRAASDHRRAAAREHGSSGVSAGVSRRRLQVAAAEQHQRQQRGGGPPGIPSLQQLLASSSSDSCSCCSASSLDEETPYSRPPEPHESVADFTIKVQQQQQHQQQQHASQQQQEFLHGDYQIGTTHDGLLKSGVRHAMSLQPSMSQSLWGPQPDAQYLADSAAPVAPEAVEALQTTEDAAAAAVAPHANALPYEGWWGGGATPLLLSPSQTPIGAPSWGPQDSGELLHGSEQQQQQQLPLLQHERSVQKPFQGPLPTSLNGGPFDEWGGLPGAPRGPLCSSPYFADGQAPSLLTKPADLVAVSAAAPCDALLRPLHFEGSGDLRTAGETAHSQELTETLQATAAQQQSRQRRRTEGSRVEQVIQKRQRHESRKRGRSKQQQHQMLVQQETAACSSSQQQQQHYPVLSLSQADLNCSSENMLQQQLHVATGMQQEQCGLAAATESASDFIHGYAVAAPGAQGYPTHWQAFPEHLEFGSAEQLAGPLTGGLAVLLLG